MLFGFSHKDNYDTVLTLVFLIVIRPCRDSKAGMSGRIPIISSNQRLPKILTYPDHFSPSRCQASLRLFYLWLVGISLRGASSPDCPLQEMETEEGLGWHRNSLVQLAVFKGTGGLGTSYWKLGFAFSRASKSRLHQLRVLGAWKGLLLLVESGRGAMKAV